MGNCVWQPDRHVLYIELVDYVEADLGFDESKYIKMARRDMNLSISKQLPQGDALTFIEKVRVYANRNGYESMRVRWRDPEITKPQSAKVDTSRQDAGEAFFIKSSEVHLRGGLPDISAEISMELVNKMKDLVD